MLSTNVTDWYIGGSWKFGEWSFRYKKFILQLKAPWNTPLFSERYGYSKPVFKLGEWRLLHRNR